MMSTSMPELKNLAEAIQLVVGLYTRVLFFGLSAAGLSPHCVYIFPVGSFSYKETIAIDLWREDTPQFDYRLNF